MENETEINVEVTDAAIADIVAEIQQLRTEIVNGNTIRQGLHGDVTLLVLFVAVLVIYRLRDVFLSFVKKGGIKGV